MAEILILLGGMGKIIIFFGLFPIKSLNIAEILILLGEVGEIIILVGLERGLRAHGRSLGAHGYNPAV